jgi:hypothetical protein
LLTLTYYHVADGSIINNREGQDILNANGVTFHATSGLLTWTLQPADTVIVLDSYAVERHRALLEWTLNNGVTGKHEVDILVRNLGKVP